MQDWQLEEGETLRVKSKVLGIEDVGKLVSSIEENESITAIDIRERGLNDESCGLLMAAALRCSRLRRLHLSGNSIGDVGAQHLAVNLQALSSVLTHLDLSQNRLGPTCCKDLASSFFQQHNSTTQPKELTLDLSDNGLSDQGVVAIVGALSRATNDGIKLKVRLMLRQVFCTDQGLMTLASVLPSLVGLHVAYNPISAVSLGSMCKVLTEQVNKNNSRLRELDLSSLQQLDAGGRAGDAEGKSLLQRFDALSSMLVRTSAVREFVFAGNFLGDVGVEKISNGISENKSHNLERLGLSSNGIGAKGVAAICRAMRKMADNGKGLRVLELDSNRLDDECARKLGDAVSWSPNLSRLLLSRNSIGDVGGAELAHGIARQLEIAASMPPRFDGWPGVLIELDLDFNLEIADKAAKALADAICPKFIANTGPFSQPWGLERLRVVGTRVAEGKAELGAESLARVVQRRQALATEALEALVTIATTATTENIEAGASTLKLEDVSGLLAGMLLTISGGGNSETKTIVSVNADSSTLDGRLQHAYTQGASIVAKAIQQNPEPWAKTSWVPSGLKVFGIDLERFRVEKRSNASRRASYRALRCEWPQKGREHFNAAMRASGETLLEGRHPVWAGERLRAAKRPRPRHAKAKQRSGSSSSSSTCEDGGRSPWQPPRQQDIADNSQVDELSASEHRRRSESGGTPAEASKQVFAYLPCQDVTTVTERPKNNTERSSGFFDQPRKSLASLVGGFSSLFGPQQLEAMEMDDDTEEQEEVRDAVGDWFEDESDLGPRVHHIVDHLEQPHGAGSVHRGRRQRQQPTDFEGSDTASTSSSVCHSALGSSEYGSAVGSTTAPSSSRLGSNLGQRTSGSGSALVTSAAIQPHGRVDARGDGLFAIGDNLGTNYGSGGRDSRESGNSSGVIDALVSSVTKNGIGVSDGREERYLRPRSNDPEGISGVEKRDCPQLGTAGLGFVDGREERDLRCTGDSRERGLGDGSNGSPHLARGEGNIGDGREERDLRYVGDNRQADSAIGTGERQLLGGDGVRVGPDKDDRELRLLGSNALGYNSTAGEVKTTRALGNTCDTNGGAIEARDEIARLRFEISKAEYTEEIEKLKAALHAAETRADEAEKQKEAFLNKQRCEREAEVESLRGKSVVAKSSSSPVLGPKEPPNLEASPKPKGETTKGKAAGKGIPPKGAGKGPPGKGGPPGNPPKAPPKGKAKAVASDPSKAKAKATTQASAAEMPFGRKIHFQKPMYELGEACVWGELSPEDEAEFSPELLTALFAQQENDQKKKGRWSVASASKKSTGVSIIDGKRAQNMAIVLGRLPCSTKELCRALMACDFESAALSVDDIELVQGVLPTEDEIKQLKEYENKVEELRDIEQKVLPFCAVEKGAVRLNIMRVAVTHCGTCRALLVKLEAVKKACEEVRQSDRFRKLLKTVLQMGNYINAAKCEDSSMKGFAIESLPVLCTFKAGQVSSLHFLCLTLRKDDAFLRELKSDLSKIPEAAKLKLDHLEGQVNMFAKDKVFVEAQAKVLDCQEGHHRLVDLNMLLGEEAEELASELQATQAAADDVQKFFGVNSIKGSEKMPPIADFMEHIAKFLEQLTAAWTEIERNPAKWQKFEKSGKHQEGEVAEAEQKRRHSSFDSTEIALAVASVDNTSSEGVSSRVARVRPKLSITKRAAPKMLKSDAEKDPSTVDSTIGLASRSPAGSDIGPQAVLASRTLQRKGTAPAELHLARRHPSETETTPPHVKGATEQAALETKDDTSMADESIVRDTDKANITLPATSCRMSKEVEATDSSTTAPPLASSTMEGVQSTSVKASVTFALDEASLATSCMEETVADLRSGGISVSGGLKTSAAVCPPREEDLEPFSGNDLSLLASNDDTDSIGPWDSASQVALATPWPRSDTHAPSPESVDEVASTAAAPHREVGEQPSNAAESNRVRPALQATQERAALEEATDQQKATPQALGNAGTTSTTPSMSRPARGIGTLAAAAAARAGHAIAKESSSANVEASLYQEPVAVQQPTAPQMEPTTVVLDEVAPKAESKGKGKVKGKGKGKGKKLAPPAETPHESPSELPTIEVGTQRRLHETTVLSDVPSSEAAMQNEAGNAKVIAEEEEEAPELTLQDLQHRKSFVAALDKRFRIVAEAEESTSCDNLDAALKSKVLGDIVSAEILDARIVASVNTSNEALTTKENDVAQSSQALSSIEASHSSEEEF